VRCKVRLALARLHQDLYTLNDGSRLGREASRCLTADALDRIRFHVEHAYCKSYVSTVNYQQ
jgi:pyruvate formate-lyase activating enzyme-like uncharacterized protein